MDREAVGVTPCSVTLEAVVIRKDGTREDHGVIAASYRSPFRQLGWRLKQWLRGKSAGRIVMENRNG